MSLTDLMSAMDLAAFPIVSLVIFLGVFVLISIRVKRATSAEMHDAAMLPMSDEPTANPVDPTSNATSDKGALTC